MYVISGKIQFLFNYFKRKLGFFRLYHLKFHYLSEAVMEETIWPIIRLRFWQEGLSMPRFLRQMSQMASLSTMKAQSECSRVVWVVRMELQGSTTAVQIWGVTKILKFLGEYSLTSYNQQGKDGVVGLNRGRAYLWSKKNIQILRRILDKVL